MASAVRVLPVVFAWFAASTVCTSSSKATLLDLTPHKCAFALTASQFVLSAVFSLAILAVMGKKPVIPEQARSATVAIGLVYTAGFALLNLSLGRLAASFAETVRGLEPIFTALFAVLFRVRGGRLGPRAGGSLGALLCGAAVVVYSQPALSLSGLTLGLLANLMFAARSLLTTAAQDRVGRTSLEANALFFYQHLIGSLVMVPLALLSGGSTCVELTLTHAVAPKAALMSAAAFFAYNRLSLSVLLMLDAASLSVCSALRRTVTIGVAALLFSTKLDAPTITGAR